MARHRALLHHYLDREQLRADYVETTRAGEARELALQAAQAQRPIVIIGGDGSVNEVINGMLQSGQQVPLGIVAAGSGNDFATSTLKLPLDPAAAIERAFSGRPVSVDAGKVNGSYFVNACGIGLDADIAEAVGLLKKYPLLSGKRLYYTAMLRQLLFHYHRCPWLTLHLDGSSQTERHYILVAVSNGPAYGAGFRVNPTARYNDGLLDVCAIDHMQLLRALKLLPVIQKGEHAWVPEVTFHRVRSLQIESRVPVNIQIDGETTRATSFAIEVIPGALTIRI
jgi:diacylglycerol kinase (ATP)